MAMRALAQPPTDGITRLRFAPVSGQSNLLLASSWDAGLRLYDANSGNLLATQRHPFAMLDCAFNANMSCALAGGLGKALLAWDIQTLQQSQVGQHEMPIRCVEFHAPTQQVFTGSWDRTVSAWDLRQGSGSPSACVRLGAKVFCMDVGRQNQVVVGGSDRCTHIFDARQLQQPVHIERQESCLNNQLRAVKVGVDQTRYASASVEGRVAVELFNPKDNEELRYAFKCHRLKQEDGSEVVYPVNAIAFHPAYGTFATGGSDGCVNVWDIHAKKRVCRLDPFDTAVACLDFSADGSTLAIGVSDPSANQVAGPAPQVVVRRMDTAEVAPKAVQTQ
mmetsp:Transcript_42157/g.98874  ORF Transcript_42157/g.98874 Transcript_42157/m.98874 type:complete len:334 (-) Transcript_42157:74-1075(-)